MAGRWQENQSPEHNPAEFDGFQDDEDGDPELPHELVGQYVDLGKRRAAVWEAMLELMSQHFGFGSVANLDDETKEDLEEQLEELVIEVYEANR